MLVVPVIKDNIDKALKLFKRKFRDTKIPKEIRARKQFTKPSTKRKLEKEKSIKKNKYNEENDE
tara:strand:- start:299 stop:490 length:192 start_codon:yes stop_codon:yes gene_type:complete